MKITKKLIKDKKSFEMSFTLMFAIIAGTVILLLAIYGVSRFIVTTQKTQYSEAALSILNILNPIVNDIEDTYVKKPLEFKKETRIYLGCSVKGDKGIIFGKQTLAFSEESGFLKKWPEPGLNISRYNKYIFADKIEQGKSLQIFSKPFYAGFRVDDLIMMNVEDFCFVASPEFIKYDVENKGFRKINVTTSTIGCKNNSVKVCFGFSSSACEIVVYGECNSGCEKEGYDYGYVQKNGKTVKYTGNLIYAAIFSSPEIYECNVQRLGKKIAELGKVYLDEVKILETKNCNTLIEPYLVELISSSQNITSSNGLKRIYNAGKAMDEKNCENEMCRVYSSEDC